MHVLCLKKYRLYFICEEEYQPARQWYAENISWWPWKTIHSLVSGYHNKFVPKLLAQSIYKYC